MSWELFREVLYGLAPPLGVSFVFYVVLRAIIRADASEREAERQFGQAGPVPTAEKSDAPTAPTSTGDVE